MDRRYQVFVSSTFRDLHDERQEVMQALLELDCIPAGMELFPAANEDQWSLIKRVIDNCDYYIVIIGGRYGSLGPDGVSYTEMEYRYALEQTKPVIAFLHKDPVSLTANRTEETDDGKSLLIEFRKLVEKKMVKYWTTPSDLGSVVSRSLITLIKNRPAIGWVRADKIPDESTAEDMLRLRKRVEELESQLRAARTQPPKGAEDLAQGDDEFEVNYEFEATSIASFTEKELTAAFVTTWNDVFAAVSPSMMDDLSERSLKLVLDTFVEGEVLEHLETDADLKEYNLSDFAISHEDFQTIKVQLNALGLISKSPRQRSVKDNNTYWTLTPYGEETMMRLRAIRKS